MDCENLEILTNTYLSNCKDLNELQNLYIKLTNGLDDLVLARQKELEGS